MKEKLKTIDLESLPKYNGGRYDGKIDWSNSIGYSLKFNYDNIIGCVEIVQYVKTEELLYIKYLDFELFKISTKNLRHCRLGKLLGKKTKDFKIDIGQEFIDEKRNFIIVNREYRKFQNKQDIKYYNYKCNLCNWNEGWMTEGN